METGGDEEQDGLSVHSPGQAPPSSASSLPKEYSQVDLELRILEALEIYPPAKLQGIHRHFVLYGLMEFMQKRFDKHFTAEEILQLLDRFYNLEMLARLANDHMLMSNLNGPMGMELLYLDRRITGNRCMYMLEVAITQIKTSSHFVENQKPDDEEMECINHEEDFSLPQSFFVKEET